MLDLLKHIEANVLPALLADASNWKSLYVDYHPPFVQRLWVATEVDGKPYRLYLHRILPCKLREALFHTHPWPSAMRILSGRYTMIVGHAEGNEAPPVSMTLSLPTGATYEMVHPDGWHAVCPEGEPAYSLMVTGEPWKRESPKSPYPLSPLEPALQDEILAFFRNAYRADAVR
jgi:hypothetical protein